MASVDDAVAVVVHLDVVVALGHQFEPAVQRTYADFAAHFNIAVLAARPRKPRDKAKVESGVQLVQRWILARLRNVAC